MFQHPRAHSARQHRRALTARTRRIVTLASVSALALAGIGAARSTAATTAEPDGSAAPAAALQVPDSEFSIPQGAAFVAGNGSDRNPGTQAAPFRTITHAVAVARSGATVVVRAGTYREALGSITKRVTIQAYPHEQVWLKGSVPVAGFVASGQVWVKTGWSDRLCHTCTPRSAIDPAYPAAGLPDQVFVDGRPLAQVTTPAQVKPGTFAVDTQRHRLVLGSDPAGHRVEATYFPVAMQFNSRAAGSQLLGIGVSEYGPQFDYRQPAMVIANTTDLTFDADAFDRSATRGLSVLRSGGVVERSVFLDNGANALHANRADGLLVMGNRFAYSNREHFSIAGTATASIAAVKVTLTTNALVKANYLDDNASNAVWFDVNSYNVTVADNAIVRNAGFGIMYEISAHGLLAGNVVVANGRDGIRVSGSTNVDMWNNTLADNAWSQIGVYDDGRTQPDRAYRARGITWDTAEVRAFNNVLVGGPDATGPLWNSFDGSRPRHLTTLQMVSADDRNLFVSLQPAPAAGASAIGATAIGPPAAPLAAWQTTLQTTTRWPTLTALQAATGREQGSSTPGDGSTACLPLPAEVAAAMGVSTPLRLGAPLMGIVAPGSAW